jgi:hypothetical protein
MQSNQVLVTRHVELEDDFIVFHSKKLLSILSWNSKMVRVFPMCIGRLLSIAEETVTEFISKATGTAIDWIQLPGMKVSVLTLNLHYQFLDVLDS